MGEWQNMHLAQNWSNFSHASMPLMLIPQNGDTTISNPNLVKLRQQFSAAQIIYTKLYRCVSVGAGELRPPCQARSLCRHTQAPVLAANSPFLVAVRLLRHLGMQHHQCEVVAFLQVFAHGQPANGKPSVSRNASRTVTTFRVAIIGAFALRAVAAGGCWRRESKVKHLPR